MKAEVKITEFKSGLSRYLRSAQNGNRIIIKDGDTPIAELVPYRARSDRLASIPPTRPLKDLDKLPVFAPKRLTARDVDEALHEDRRERLNRFLP